MRATLTPEQPSRDEQRTRRTGALQHHALQRGDPSRLGRYRIMQRLGTGGMGIAYLAHDRDGTPVAVKLLHRHLCADPIFRRRFAGEIAAAIRVNGLGAPRLLYADPDASPLLDH